MDRLKLVIAVLLGVLVAGVLVFFLVRSDGGPRGDKELQSLIEGFMKTVPDTTTVEQRQEIQGIMDRFYYNAVRGNLAADDVISIEGDLRGYAEKGGIPAEELFPFMTKVGKATRRAAGGGGEPTG
jgi:hypothetical protein